MTQATPSWGELQHDLEAWATESEWLASSSGCVAPGFVTAVAAKQAETLQARAAQAGELTRAFVSSLSTIVEATQMAVLVGPPGSDLSGAAAHLALANKHTAIPVFVGADLSTCSHLAVLAYLVQTVGKLLGVEEPAHGRVPELSARLGELLAILAKRQQPRSVVVIIDGIEVLLPVDGAADLAWLPAPPPGAKFVVTVQSPAFSGTTLSVSDRRVVQFPADENVALAHIFAPLMLQDAMLSAVLTHKLLQTNAGCARLVRTALTVTQLPAFRLYLLEELGKASTYSAVLKLVLLCLMRADERYSHALRLLHIAQLGFPLGLLGAILGVDEAALTEKLALLLELGVVTQCGSLVSLATAQHHALIAEEIDSAQHNHYCLRVLALVLPQLVAATEGRVLSDVERNQLRQSVFLALHFVSQLEGRRQWNLTVGNSPGSQAPESAPPPDTVQKVVDLLVSAPLLLWLPLPLLRRSFSKIDTWITDPTSRSPIQFQADSLAAVLAAQAPTAYPPGAHALFHIVVRVALLLRDLERRRGAQSMISAHGGVVWHAIGKTSELGSFLGCLQIELDCANSPHMQLPPAESDFSKADLERLTELTSNQAHGFALRLYAASLLGEHVVSSTHELPGLAALREFRLEVMRSIDAHEIKSNPRLLIRFLRAIGFSHWALGEHGDAAQVLSIAQSQAAALGKSSVEYAGASYAMANVLMAQKKYAEANQLLALCRQTFSRVFSERHTAYGWALLASATAAAEVEPRLSSSLPSRTALCYALAAFRCADSGLALTSPDMLPFLEWFGKNFTPAGAATSEAGRTALLGKLLPLESSVLGALSSEAVFLGPFFDSLQANVSKTDYHEWKDLALAVFLLRLPQVQQHKTAIREKRSFAAESLEYGPAFECSGCYRQNLIGTRFFCTNCSHQLCLACMHRDVGDSAAYANQATQVEASKPTHFGHIFSTRSEETLKLLATSDLLASKVLALKKSEGALQRQLDAERMRANELASQLEGAIQMLIEGGAFARLATFSAVRREVPASAPAPAPTAGASQGGSSRSVRLPVVADAPGPLKGAPVAKGLTPVAGPPPEPGLEFFKNLPFDVIVHGVCKYLPSASLAQLRLTCRKNRDAVEAAVTKNQLAAIVRLDRFSSAVVRVEMQTLEDGTTVPMSVHAFKKTAFGEAPVNSEMRFFWTDRPVGRSDFWNTTDSDAIAVLRRGWTVLNVPRENPGQVLVLSPSLRPVAATVVIKTASLMSIVPRGEPNPSVACPFVVQVASGVFYSPQRKATQAPARLLHLQQTGDTVNWTAVAFRYFYKSELDTLSPAANAQWAEWNKGVFVVVLGDSEKLVVHQIVRDGAVLWDTQKNGALPATNVVRVSYLELKSQQVLSYVKS
eukprot:TRINITY_DN6015_c0_g1_i1.p1 TRINITY_DN6015_c0_g1~~TRINITY_DN6015_c0_g1_i1.p1  ORF type:complete len:1377 (-),score=371.99 TRINITY_DN6015_c0_g1_i1:18-4148(-)